MNIETLNKIANQMVQDSKGILAMDESHGTCKKRFDSLNIPVTEENRRSYRDMLITADSLNNYILKQMPTTKMPTTKMPTTWLSDPEVSSWVQGSNLERNDP